MGASQVVPGVGFVLPVEGTLLDTPSLRTMVSAAPVTAAATVTAAIFAAGEEVSVRTRVANERILLILNVQRSNDNAAGLGTYRTRVDGAAAGALGRNSIVGVLNGEVTVVSPVTIAAAGAHPINAQVTSAAAGNETVAAGATLAIWANEFV